MLILLALLLGAPGIESLLAAHGWGRPQRTPSLDEAAAALARRVDLQADGQIAAGQLRFVLEEAGVVDAQVVPFVATRPAQRPTLLTRLDRRAPPTHLGVARIERDGQRIEAALLVHRGFRSDAPLPRAQTAGAFSVSGTLRPGYFSPRLIVAPPARAVRDRPVAAAGRRVSGVVRLDAGPGIYRVELVAESQYGPVVLVNHRVFVDVPVPQRPTVRLRPPTDFDAPALLLTAWINDLRQHNRRLPLAVHPRLVEVAARHAADLRAQGRLAHFSADSGSLTTRLKAAGVATRRVAENLAEADDPRGAIRALLDSPGHKRNLLLRDMTHIGVGVSGRYYAVVLARISPTRASPARP